MLDSHRYVRAACRTTPSAGVITVVLVTGLTGPAIATPGSVASSDVAGEEAGR
jgi:hypothetical protein